MPPKPFAFQVSMPDDTQFNHEIIVDLFCIDKKPALHAVGRGAHFSAAKFLQGESAIHVWSALIDCWISACVGFPNALSHDQGPVFASKLFDKAASHAGIALKGAPAEAHNALSAGERYHGLLRRICSKMRIEYPELDKELALSIAASGLTCAAGPDGLAPALLALGMAPKIPLGHVDALMPDQRKRFAAMEAAKKEMEAIVAEQRIMAAQKRSTPSLDILDLRKGDAALESSGNYEIS